MCLTLCLVFPCAFFFVNGKNDIDDFKILKSDYFMTFGIGPFHIERLAESHLALAILGLFYS